MVLSTSNLQRYAAGSPVATLPSASDFPSGLKQLTTVLGLGLLSEYNFQISFDGGQAKTIRFVRA